MSYRGIMWSGDNQFAQTPPLVWEKLHAEFGEDLFDPCPPNPTEDGLAIDWKERNYVNPPYDNCAKWMQKAVQEKQKGNMTVCLVPARTNTNWFHEWIVPHAAELRFIQNGIKFVGYKRKSPFAVMLVMFRPEYTGELKVTTVNYYPERAPYPKNRKKRTLKPKGNAPKVRKVVKEVVDDIVKAVEVKNSPPEEPVAPPPEATVEPPEEPIAPSPASPVTSPEPPASPPASPVASPETVAPPPASPITEPVASPPVSPVSPV